MPSIRVFTKPIDKHDPVGLALAIHATLTCGGVEYALNHGHALLYGEAEIDANDQIIPRFLANPRIARAADAGFILAADVTDGEGRTLGQSAWHTVAFDTFVLCHPVKDGSDTAQVTDAEATAILANWNLHCESVSVPEEIRPSDLAQTRAVAHYSDGSTHAMPVDWAASAFDLTQPGCYTVEGRIRRPELPFPLTENTGDPVLLHWEGRWYFFSTNDANGNMGLTIRRADTVEGLFAPGWEESCILDKDEAHGICHTFWAPETHLIGGRLCVLFAVSGKAWSPQCHLMRLKEGGDPFRPEDWDLPRPVRRSDGTPLFADQLNIDMTCLDTPGGSYYVWSTRRDCMGPRDSGSMLAIARMNPDDPWAITTEPMILARPLLGFENVSGTINNEGPYALVTQERVCLFYSGGDAAGYTYCLGLMEADPRADLMQMSNWRKAPYPLLHFRSMPGIYGPGHHSFFQWDGETYIAHHAVTSLDSRVRCAAVHRVHFDAKGRPRLDVCPERELPLEMAAVHTTLVVD